MSSRIKNKEIVALFLIIAFMIWRFDFMKIAFEHSPIMMVIAIGFAIILLIARI